MKSRYQALGFGPEDEIGLRSFEHHARQAGLTAVQTQRWLEAFARDSHQFGNWPMERKVEWANAQAHTLGLGTDQLQAIVGWGNAAIERGAHDVAFATPAAADLRREQAEIEQIMKDNPDQYWSDENLQLRYSDVLEAQSARTDLAPIGATFDVPAQAAPVAPQAHRGAVIEAMMGDHSSEYWRGPKAEALQAEYRSLVAPAGNDQSATPSTPEN
jgi:hypothetical protein